jgi:hypothetical protein
MKRKNRRALRRGLAMRASDLAFGRSSGQGQSQLLPSLAGRPADAGRVDPDVLRLELVHLCEVGRRAGNS